MRVHYSRPIKNENLDKISIEIGKALARIREAKILRNIISPVCAFLSLLTVSFGPLTLISLSEYSEYLESLKDIPFVSYYYGFILKLASLFPYNDIVKTVIMFVISIIVPLVVCFVITLFVRPCIHHKISSVCADESGKSVRARLVYEQAVKLKKTKIRSPRAIWNTLVAIILLVLFALYLVSIGSLDLGNVKSDSSIMLTTTPMALLFGLIVYFITWITKFFVTKICLLKPKYDTTKLIKHITDYRLSVDIDSIVAAAIKDRSFYVNYQPIYHIEDQKFSSAEALARLDNPVYSSISPAIFIEAAEQSGQISGLTDVILSHVCEFVSSERFEKSCCEFVHINLSVIDCVKPSRIQEIIAIVDSYGISHDKISFEITESATASSKDQFWDAVELLAKSGFIIDMDDFGTGYSSLSKVISDAFSVIKLDRSLIADKSDKNKKTLLNDIVNMLKHLDKTIVMEGVETKEQLDLVKELGIECIQGYYYSKPLKENDFIDFLQVRSMEQDIG